LIHESLLTWFYVYLFTSSISGRILSHGLWLFEGRDHWLSLA
jgi:hypothetical protein